MGKFYFSQISVFLYQKQYSLTLQLASVTLALVSHKQQYHTAKAYMDICACTKVAVWRHFFFILKHVQFDFIKLGNIFFLVRYEQSMHGFTTTNFKNHIIAP